MATAVMRDDRLAAVWFAASRGSTRLVAVPVPPDRSSGCLSILGLNIGSGSAGIMAIVVIFGNRDGPSGGEDVDGGDRRAVRAGHSGCAGGRRSGRGRIVSSIVQRRRETMESRGILIINSQSE